MTVPPQIADSLKDNTWMRPTSGPGQKVEETV